jgi:hypothetical protein
MSLNTTKKIAIGICPEEDPGTLNWYGDTFPETFYHALPCEDIEVTKAETLIDRSAIKDGEHGSVQAIAGPNRWSISISNCEVHDDIPTDGAVVTDLPVSLRPLLACGLECVVDPADSDAYLFRPARGCNLADIFTDSFDGKTGSLSAVVQQRCGTFKTIIGATGNATFKFSAGPDTRFLIDYELHGLCLDGTGFENAAPVDVYNASILPDFVQTGLPQVGTAVNRGAWNVPVRSANTISGATLVMPGFGADDVPLSLREVTINLNNTVNAVQDATKRYGFRPAFPHMDGYLSVDFTVGVGQAFSAEAWQRAFSGELSNMKIQLTGAQGSTFELEVPYLQINDCTETDVDGYRYYSITGLGSRLPKGVGPEVGTNSQFFLRWKPGSSY